MSLLVCGFAGAFCFRVDPVAVDEPAAGDERLTAADAPAAAGPPPEPVRLADAPSKPEPRRKRRPKKPAGPPPPPVPALLPPPVAEPAAVAEVPVPPALPPEPPVPEPAAAAGPRTYAIRPGDTLSGIAERELGSHRRYREIFEANRDVLRSPDAIRVGMTLRLPGAGPL